MDTQIQMLKVFLLVVMFKIHIIDKQFQQQVQDVKLQSVLKNF